MIQKLQLFFNEIFASVGPDLAKHIPETGKSPTEYIKKLHN